MKVFFDAIQRSHTPSRYLADGQLCDAPESPARADAILAQLKRHPSMTILPPLSIDPFPAITTIHRLDYLHYLETIHAIWSAEFGESDVLPDTFFPRNRISPPTKPSAQAGYYCFDLAAPITATTWQSALASAHSAASAAQTLINGEPSAYALCRPPGHHAGSNYCGGFCYLNNIAIAAQYLLNSANFKKIAILDIDYHHGNGTQDIFYHRDDVLVISIHADPNTQYPYFWGHAFEQGKGPGEGFNLNLPLPRGCSEDAWLAAFDIALKRIQTFSPDALLISFGADTHAQDLIGDFQLTENSYQRIAKLLKSLHLPTAFFQEGGYNLDVLGKSVATLLHTFESKK